MDKVGTKKEWALSTIVAVFVCLVHLCSPTIVHGINGTPYDLLLSLLSICHTIGIEILFGDS